MSLPGDQESQSILEAREQAMMVAFTVHWSYTGTDKGHPSSGALAQGIALWQAHGPGQNPWA